MRKLCTVENKVGSCYNTTNNNNNNNKLFISYNGTYSLCKHLQSWANIYTKQNAMVMKSYLLNSCSQLKCICFFVTNYTKNKSWYLKSKTYKTPEDLSLFSTKCILELTAHNGFKNTSKSWYSCKRCSLIESTVNDFSL